MPRVPEYTPSQGVPGSAPFAQASGAAFGAETAQLVEQGAQQIEAAGNLALRHTQYIEAEKARQRQVNDVLTHMNAMTEGIGNDEQDLQQGYTGPDGKTVPPVGSKDYVQEWGTKFKTRSNGLLQQVEDPTTKTALDIGLKRLYDARLISAQHFATNLHVQEQESADKQNAVTSATLAVQAPSPEERNRIIDTYNAALDLKYQGSRPKYVETLKENFANHVQANYMEKTLNDDPIKFSIQRDAGAFKDVPMHQQIQILDRYNSKVNQQRVEAERLNAINRHLGQQPVYADANYGILPQNVIDQIKTGNHPYFDAQDGHAIETLNNNAPNGAGSYEIRALRKEYLEGDGYKTKEGIAAYQKRAAEMSKTLGVQSPEYLRLQEEFKADWKSITNADNTAITKNVQAFKDANDQNKKTSPFGGPMGKITENKEKKLEAYGELLVRKYGYSFKDATDAVEKRRQEERKARSNTLQGTIDAIKVR